MTTSSPNNIPSAQEVVDEMDKLARQEGTTLTEKLRAAYDSQIGSKAVRSAESDVETPEE